MDVRMNSIFNIYESLLSKTSTKVKGATLEITAEIGNQENSDLRRFFRQPQTNMYDPFEVKNKSLIVHPYNNIYLTGDEGKLTDIIGNNFDKLVIEGALYCGDKTDIGKCLYPVVDAESFTLNDDCVIENVELTAVSYNNRRFPMIYINGNTLTNCKLEIAKSNTKIGHLRSVGIPTFNNVQSDTIEEMAITHNSSTVSGPKFDLFADDRWNKLFDLGYTLGVTILGAENKTKNVKIKSLMDIRKLVVGRQFYSKVYDQSPYKLKLGAKLSDVVDISKFHNLNLIVVKDDKMEIRFENTKLLSDTCASKLLLDVLRENTTNNDEKAKNEIIDKIPVTADGWRVVIMKL
jgi:hypothetical protein